MRRYLPHAAAVVVRLFCAVTIATLPEAGARAENRAPTPEQPRGPFYPSTLPAEDDNDLTRYAGRTAKGQPIVVTGQVRTRDGKPVAGTKVEIWQTNAEGRYHHPRDNSAAAIDPGFQGWGQTTTSADGAYRFRTIKPIAYSGRTPHIHFAITAPDEPTFHTQMYFADAQANDADFLLRRMTPDERNQLMVTPAKSDTAADPVARFDVVLP